MTSGASAKMLRFRWSSGQEDQWYFKILCYLLLQGSTHKQKEVNLRLQPSRTWIVLYVPCHFIITTHRNTNVELWDIVALSWGCLRSSFEMCLHIMISVTELHKFHTLQFAYLFCVPYTGILKTGLFYLNVSLEK